MLHSRTLRECCELAARTVLTGLVQETMPANRVTTRSGWQTTSRSAAREGFTDSAFKGGSVLAPHFLVAEE